MQPGQLASVTCIVAAVVGATGDGGVDDVVGRVAVPDDEEAVGFGRVRAAVADGGEVGVAERVARTVVVAATGRDGVDRGEDDPDGAAATGPSSGTVTTSASPADGAATARLERTADVVVDEAALPMVQPVRQSPEDERRSQRADPAPWPGGGHVLVSA